MPTKTFFRAIALLCFATLSIGLLACNATSQGLSSGQFDTIPAAKSRNSKTPATLASAPTLNLDLSVEEAYRAIPHRRTAMDFAASNIPTQERRYLEVAFHLIDQAIRLRVTAYRKFSQGETGDAGLIADMGRIIEFLQSAEPPANLSSYHKQLFKALSDQRAYFEEWSARGGQFQYGSHNRLASHPKVQGASNALKAAYGILMEIYSAEGDNNKQAFFDYHCALDFL
ncbi:MAG TPA: hypothetical protein VJ842_13115 [Pyrinomonadaceae bacterium]|nr:hypothetical protein [Pyrinomonadaceae bacterium]